MRRTESRPDFDSAQRVEAHFNAIANGDWQLALRGMQVGTTEDCDAIARLVAANAAASAHAPISDFAVGAAVVDAHQRVFFGANFEFPGLPLAASVHAEQSAIAVAVAGDAGPIKTLAVTAVPCGHCRQFLCELQGAADLRVLVGTQDAATTLATLYPDPFTPAHLDKAARLLAVLEPKPPVALEPGDSASATLGGRARAMLPRAHASYSDCPTAVALRDIEGRMVSAPSMESVAHNPSMTGMQSACAVFAASGGRLANLTDAVMTAAPHAPMDHEAASRMLLRAVSDVTLRRVDP